MRQSHANFNNEIKHLAYSHVSVRFLSIVISVLFFFNQAHSQEQSSTDMSVWSDFKMHYVVNSKISYSGETGIRAIGIDNPTWRIYIKPSLDYQIKGNTRFVGGLVYFYNTDLESELRFFQGIKAVWPLEIRFPIAHYLRIEERTFSADDITNMEFRLRYKISTDIKFITTSIIKYYYIPLSAEIFIDLSKGRSNFNNQLRLTAGLGYVFNINWSAEANLLFEKSKISESDPYETNNIVLRIRIVKRINGEGKGLRELFKAK